LTTDHTRYRFSDVGTFGGPVSYLTNDETGTGSPSGVLNDRGSIVSAADTSIPNPNFPNVCILCPSADPLVVNAFLWQNDHLADLGALPGGNNSWANWISSNGLIAGYSETGQIDPLLGVPAIDAVLWKHGQIADLGTIEGGYESAAFAVNNRAQIVGGFVNTIPDPFSPFGYQVRAFLWNAGLMQDLGTLGGPEATAYFVNERGQIAGISFINSIANSTTGLPTQDPFLWEDGAMIDLGTLGGTFGTPNFLDNTGRVIGQSNLAGDLSHHPFLWTKAQGMQDLGTFGGSSGQANWMNEKGEIVGFANSQGDQALFGFVWQEGKLTNLGTLKNQACSAALGINSKTQIVGLSSETCSFTASDRHAVLWDGGYVIDLNTFLPAGVTLQRLTDAYSINDRGEIAGLGVPAGCNDEFTCGHVFVLTPCEAEASGEEGCSDDFPDVATAAAQPSTWQPDQSKRDLSAIGLTPREIAGRMQERFRRSHGFAIWPQK